MFIRRKSLETIAAVLAAGAVFVAEAVQDASALQRFKQDARQMGKKAGKAAKEVGQGVGQGSKRTFKTIKREFRSDVIEGGPANSPPTPNRGGRD